MLFLAHYLYLTYKFKFDNIKKEMYLLFMFNKTIICLAIIFFINCATVNPYKWDRPGSVPTINEYTIVYNIGQNNIIKRITIGNPLDYEIKLKIQCREFSGTKEYSMNIPGHEYRYLILTVDVSFDLDSVCDIMSSSHH